MKKVRIADCKDISFFKEEKPTRECIGASTVYQNGFYVGVVVNTAAGYGICLNKAHRFEYEAFDDAIDYIDFASNPTYAWQDLVSELEISETRVTMLLEAKRVLLDSCCLIKNFELSRFERLKKIEDFLLEIEGKPNVVINNLPIKQRIYALLGRKNAMRLMRFLPKETDLLQLYNAATTNDYYIIDILDIIHTLEAAHGKLFSIDAPILNSYLISIAFGTAKIAQKFRKEIFEKLEEARAIGNSSNLPQYKLLAQHCSRKQNEIFCHFNIYDRMLYFLYNNYCKKNRLLFIRTMADFSSYLVGAYQGKVQLTVKKR